MHGKRMHEIDGKTGDGVWKCFGPLRGRQPSSVVPVRVRCFSALES